MPVVESIAPRARGVSCANVPSLSLRMRTRAPGSRCQCPSNQVFFTQVESTEPWNLASETPTVFHGRELPAGRRDGLVGHALWLRKEAARRGYAWRQQQRAWQLSSSRAACLPPGGNVGEALRYAPSGVGVLVEAHRELATRDSGEGCWGPGGCEVCAGGSRDGHS